MRSWIVTALGLVAAGLVQAQTPNIAGMTNFNSSNVFTRLAAPGELVNLNGGNLAPSPNLGCGSASGLPFTCNGTTVAVGGRAAPVRSAGPGQVVIQVPTDIATGSAGIVVSRVINGVPTSSQPFNITVEPTAPAIAFCVHASNGAAI